MNEINKYLSKVLNKENLSEHDMIRSAQIILNGGATPAQAATLSAIIVSRGITVEELNGLIKVVDKRVIKVETPHIVMDIINFNSSDVLSTIVSFALAGCGVKVAHYVDNSVLLYMLLKEFHINISTSTESAAQYLNEIGLSFLQTSYFNRSIRHVSFLKQDFDFQNIFHYAVPFAHPVNLSNCLVITDNKQMLDTITKTIQSLRNVDNALIISKGEINTHTLFTIIRQGTVVNEDHNYNFPDSFLLKDNIQTYEESIFILKKVLSGDKDNSYRESVIIQTALGLISYGLTNSLSFAVELAQEAIDNKNAMKKLHELAELSNSYQN